MRSVIKVLLILFLFAITPAMSVNAKEDNDWTVEEIEMLQKIAMAEAEGEGPVGMALVMKTVINRVNSDDFPGTIEEVINQNNGNVWQFSSIKNGRYEDAIPNDSSMEAYEIISKLDGFECLYFENPKGKTDTWHSRNLTYLFSYKNHKFYK